MIFKIAWRNLWRNKRRSLIVSSSVVVGVVAIIFLDSLAMGFLGQMFDNQLSIHIGHIQISRAGFHENQVIQNYLPGYKDVAEILNEQEDIELAASRVVSFGLASSAHNSTGVSIIGVDPESERQLTIIARSIKEGRYLTGESGEILLSRRIAETLNVGLGERVVLMVSDMEGVVASELFRVVGIYRTFNSGFDRSHLFIPLKNAQNLLGMNDKVSQMVILLNDADKALAVKNTLTDSLDDRYEVMTYADIMPILVMQQEISGQSLLIIYVIVGIAMIFGIINTMLMSVLERIREIGVLMSIGMGNIKIFGMIVVEALYLGIVGALVGSVLGYSLMLPLEGSGLNFARFAEGLESWGIGAVVYPELRVKVIFIAFTIVLLTSLLASVYPAIKAIRLQPVIAVRHV